MDKLMDKFRVYTLQELIRFFDSMYKTKDFHFSIVGGGEMKFARKCGRFYLVKEKGRHGIVFALSVLEGVALGSSFVIHTNKNTAPVRITVTCNQKSVKSARRKGGSYFGWFKSLAYEYVQGDFDLVEIDGNKQT